MAPSQHRHHTKQPRLGFKHLCASIIVLLVLCNLILVFAPGFLFGSAPVESDVKVQDGSLNEAPAPEHHHNDRPPPPPKEKQNTAHPHIYPFMTPFIPVANSTATITNDLYIPRMIHITVPSKTNLKDGVKGNVANWKQQNPEFTLILYDDDDMLKMVKEEGEAIVPGLLEVYNGFGKVVERADLWRYLVMYLRGGLYVDSDVYPKQEIDTWHRFFDYERSGATPYATLLNDTRAGPLIQGFIGAEAHLTEQERINQNFAFRIQWCQWAFAFRPRHPFMLKLLRSIVTRVHGEKSGKIKSSGSWTMDILMRTGPGRFTVVVEEWLKEQSEGRGEKVLGSEDVVRGYEVVGSVGFMPTFAFGYRNWIDLKPPSSERVLVEHQFQQSWIREP
ncbi:hypothetical protein BC829DRAFT_490328 [Chytridium lagenaria]|nr:hypothetical protein BC829DRAFT_490328 [Chytridium lagenaria]